MKTPTAIPFVLRPGICLNLVLWSASALAQVSNAEGIAPLEGVLPSRAASTLNEAQREDRYWDDVKALGSKDAFEAYLTSYPRGRYAQLAKANLSQLKSSSNANMPKTDDSDIPLRIFKSILQDMINNQD